MTDYFDIPEKFQRRSDRTIAEALAATAIPKRRMKYPKPKKAKKPAPFALNEGDRMTLLTFGWSDKEIAAIKCRKDSEAALETCWNPATWRRRD
jgi:hypothetical protein